MKRYLIILFICFFSFAHAQNRTKKRAKNDTTNTHCLEIVGKITNKEFKPSSKYKVELYFFDELIETQTITNHLYFKFKLSKSCYYSIKIIKDGYVTKLIGIFTDMPPEIDNQIIYEYDLETVLMKNEEVNEKYIDDLDYPITIVSFDFKKHYFYMDEKYTDRLKKKIYAKKK